MTFGRDLRIGDTIEVWFGCHRATITRLEPYTGPLQCLDGARLAEFAEHNIGMTIEAGGLFSLLHRSTIATDNT